MVGSGMERQAKVGVAARYSSRERVETGRAGNAAEAGGLQDDDGLNRAYRCVVQVCVHPEAEGQRRQKRQRMLVYGMAAGRHGVFMKSIYVHSVRVRARAAEGV